MSGAKQGATKELESLIASYVRCSDGLSPLAALTAMRAIHDYVNTAQNEAYGEGRKDEAEQHAWQPIETAPEDENILVATKGGYVDTAFWTDEAGEDRKWWWLETANKYVPHLIHPDLIPTHWMPLPKHPDARAAIARAEGEQQ